MTNNDSVVSGSFIVFGSETYALPYSYSLMTMSMGRRGGAVDGQKRATNLDLAFPIDFLC